MMIDDIFGDSIFRLSQGFPSSIISYSWKFLEVPGSSWNQPSLAGPGYINTILRVEVANLGDQFFRVFLTTKTY